MKTAIKKPLKHSVKKQSKSQVKANLSAQLQETNDDLVQVKTDLVRQYITLATHEVDAAHLNAALDVLSAINKSHSLDSIALAHVELQSEVALAFLYIGRKTNNKLTLEKAKHAFRAAITLASITGNDKLREELRQNYRLTLSLLGDKPQSPSLFKVA